MSDRYERDLLEVIIERVVDSGLEIDGRNEWLTGLMCEDFFDTKIKYKDQVWDFSKPPESQVSNSLVRYRHNKYVPFDCSINGKLGDIKRYSIHPKALIPVVGDRITVACSTQQILQCRFYYVVGIRVKTISRETNYSWRIWYCVKGSHVFVPRPIVQPVVAAQPVVAQQQVVPRGVVFAGLPGNPFQIRTSVVQPATLPYI